MSEKGEPIIALYQGREALKGFLAHMHRNLEVTAFGLHEVISEGNKAAAFGWFRLHALSTGRTMDISYSILFELRAGLIVRYHFVENTFDVAAAFWAGGSWLVDTVALIALAGLVVNSTWGVRWADPVAALTLLPFILHEGREAVKGKPCC